MSLYINSINEDEIITSYNFARNSDVVFSEIVTKEQFDLTGGFRLCSAFSRRSPHDQFLNNLV